MCSETSASKASRDAIKERSSSRMGVWLVETMAHLQAITNVCDVCLGLSNMYVLTIVAKTFLLCVLGQQGQSIKWPSALCVHLRTSISGSAAMLPRDGRHRASTTPHMWQMPLMMIMLLCKHALPIHAASGKCLQCLGVGAELQRRLDSERPRNHLDLRHRLVRCARADAQQQ